MTNNLLSGSDSIVSAHIMLVKLYLSNNNSQSTGTTRLRQGVVASVQNYLQSCFWDHVKIEPVRKGIWIGMAVLQQNRNLIVAVFMVWCCCYGEFISHCCMYVGQVWNYITNFIESYSFILQSQKLAHLPVLRPHITYYRKGLLAFCTVALFGKWNRF